MSRKQFMDVPDGDTITYDVMDEQSGYRQCTFGLDTYERHLDIFNNLQNIQCRPDDIVLASYPKTGTNWLWEMLAMVLSKSSEVSGDTKGTGMLEAAPEEAVRAMPSPRLLNTHLKIKYFPKEVKEKKIKIVLLARNPKDVVVSFYNHTKGIRCYEYEGKFENYLQMFMRGEVDYGSYPEYLREWQTFIHDNPEQPIHVMSYEDMKQDCFGEMEKVCRFLELPVDADLLRLVVDNCQIDKLRKSKGDNMPEEKKEFFLTNVLKNDFSVYRKGQVGDWKNWFTDAQSKMFDNWWNMEAKDFVLIPFRYT